MSLDEAILATVERAVETAMVKHKSQSPVDPLQLLDTAEVAKLLRIEESTAREHLANGRLPGFKLAGKWRTRRTELDLFLLKQARNTTRAEVPDPAEVGAQLARDMLSGRKAG